jgi:LysR family transcriptional activator of nhaA
MVFRDAEEIFSLGHEMVSKLKGQNQAVQRLHLHVGITDMMPKLLAFRLLQPTTQIAEPVSIVCHEGKHADLLAKLSVYELDILLTDAPIGSQAKVKAFNHLLGECGVSVFAARNLAAKYTSNFPHSLHLAPFLFPIVHSNLHRSLNNWFSERRIEPTVVGEFEDSALIKIFGQSGLGLFVMPTVEEQEVLRQYDVKVVGRLAGIKMRFYAISTERKVKNPAVRAITETAQESIFE